MTVMTAKLIGQKFRDDQVDLPFNNFGSQYWICQKRGEALRLWHTQVLMFL